MPAPPSENALTDELFPLRSAAALSALLRAINTYPRGTPNRADKITRALPDEGGDFKYYPTLIEGLLADLEGTPLAATAAALDLDPTTLILVPGIDQCLLCDGEEGKSCALPTSSSLRRRGEGGGASERRTRPRGQRS